MYLNDDRAKSREIASGPQWTWVCKPHLWKGKRRSSKPGSAMSMFKRINLLDVIDGRRHHRSCWYTQEPKAQDTIEKMNKDAGLWLGFSSLILRRVMPSHAAWLKKMYLWRVYKKRDPTTGLARVFYITFRRSKWWFSPSALLLMFNVFGTAWIWGLYWVDCKDLFSFLTHS